jgi:UDP-glucose 4-epimerase
LGIGRGTSVLELVKAFEEAHSIIVPYEIVERRPEDIASLLLLMFQRQRRSLAGSQNEILSPCVGMLGGLRRITKNKG